ncbi:hypothetical protein [Mesonia maritima]|uniref:Phosphopeptide-binding protein n=1 Tax=Mesonia maritima TaxID=1793873 RepID=A0ABU1K8F6_9FLAO|nr:hypothetical protein [Mesonia maritima]MDR6300838.1 hypothetical protein [Mesonia maritima]
MKKITLFLALSTMILATSCKDDKKKDDNMDAETEMNSAEDQEMDEMDTEEAEITLSKLEGSPEFNDASLKMTLPNAMKVPAGEVTFAFDVENYDLAAPTKTDMDLGLAESDKGQHVHFILDNAPYSAHYEDSFSKDLTQGDHVVLAFLSRSYHESVKNPNSFVLQKMSVGNPTEDQQLDVDFSAPHMFYSRPKGTYKGDDTKKVLLDFFLVNTDLTNHKVRATINGQEFMIDEWVPYVMEGLPMGENTIKLELLDENGELVKSPFNPVERTVTLEE